jgi:hypothetical protein
MTEKPKFHSRMIKDGRWTVRVKTGYGPDSHIGDFATEEEAQRWIDRPNRKTGLLSRAKVTPKRPRDPNERAMSIINIATGRSRTATLTSGKTPAPYL